MLGSTLLLEACHRSPVESMPRRMQKALAALGFVTPHARCHSWKRAYSEAGFVIHSLHKHASAVYFKKETKHLPEQRDVFVLHVAQGCTNRRCPGIDFLVCLRWLLTFWSTVLGNCFWLLEFLGGSYILGNFIYTSYNNFSAVKLFRIWNLQHNKKSWVVINVCYLGTWCLKRK